MVALKTPEELTRAKAKGKALVMTLRCTINSPHNSPKASTLTQRHSASLSHALELGLGFSIYQIAGLVTYKPS